MLNSLMHVEFILNTKKKRKKKKKIRDKWSKNVWGPITCKNSAEHKILSSGTFCWRVIFCACFDSMDSTKGRSVIPLSFVSTSSGHDECRNGTSNGGFQEDPGGSPSFQDTPETDRQVGPWVYLVLRSFGGIWFSYCYNCVDFVYLRAGCKWWKRDIQ